ncbi:MAG: hypothetical protein DMG69_24525 [Acidobacteria bacterium]|nr:MAG: hypothetical protein DMG69_24525 [Acidobacteriota bacterium]
MASAGSKGAGASTQPAYTLELRAADQRRQIHSSVTEFTSQLREKLDVKRNVRAHLPVLSGATAVFGLLAVHLLVIPRLRPPNFADQRLIEENTMAVVNSLAGALSRRMSKSISPKGHAIADYIAVAAFFISGALFWRRHKRAAMSAFICGGAELALNLLTDYPGGVRPAITLATHSKLDLGLAAVTAGMPEFMDFEDDPEKSFFLVQSGAMTVLANLTEFHPERTLGKRLRKAA